MTFNAHFSRYRSCSSTMIGLNGPTRDHVFTSSRHRLRKYELQFAYLKRNYQTLRQFLIFGNLFRS